jgi:hypothetical protein
MVSGFLQGTPVSSTNKTDRHNTTEIKGLCLRPQENCRLKEFISDIENI